MQEPPAWLESLVDAASGCMQAHGVLGPVGYGWREEDGMWDVTVYPGGAELVGGASDGATVAPGFTLDVRELCAAFDEVSDVQWQAQPLGPHDCAGPHLSVEGTCGGRHVFLQVLVEAPPDEEPRFKVDVTGGSG